MIINLIYFVIGIMAGLLVKYEIDIKIKQKRMDRKRKNLNAISLKNMKKHEELLCSIKNLNDSLSLHTKKKEVR